MEKVGVLLSRFGSSLQSPDNFFGHLKGLPLSRQFKGPRIITQIIVTALTLRQTGFFVDNRDSQTPFVSAIAAGRKQDNIALKLENREIEAGHGAGYFGPHYWSRRGEWRRLKAAAADGGGHGANLKAELMMVAAVQDSGKSGQRGAAK
ncbi:hypothetical protein PIB30_071029 [Stylosanthes scabra]|uniref:Uncharacterized protein n=1 Tax=Stylosanthes scabra TaxID=79078 RepID=A0ABU6QNH3_9FABA|nr:hypothetical protein [Stylosanthes scabra]